MLKGFLVAVFFLRRRGIPHSQVLQVMWSQSRRPETNSTLTNSPKQCLLRRRGGWGILLLRKVWNPKLHRERLLRKLRRQTASSSSGGLNRNCTLHITHGKREIRFEPHQVSSRLHYFNSNCSRPVRKRTRTTVTFRNSSPIAIAANISNINRHKPLRLNSIN